jgi:hypothetical protein
MLVCSAEGDVHSSPEEEVTFNNLSNKAEKKKKYAWKHGSKSPAPCSFRLTIFIF